ncbi:radical SAM protein [uncultured Methanoculleus sp.]|jgi:MoaA/NifB/PqqE/SkfB family radical SAM enzyme|uniref:Radical SAM protein n=1 Tax=Methanoculleus palmolei TaxID=72612 RepID=A0ABD8AAR0_9EURY|nr:radical SAM protein [Methanoculleus palmolei]
MNPVYEEQHPSLKDSLSDNTTLFSASDIDINTVYYEISGICNAKCPYCSTGSGATKGKPRRFIPPEEFDRGLNRLYELEILNDDVFLGLFNWGEPFLHPQLNEILGTLKEAGQRFALSTNGSFIPDSLNSQLLENLSYLRISLPGFSQRSYDKIHQLNFGTVLHNIDVLNELVPPGTLEVGIFAYKFNITEMAEACRYFNNKNIRYQILMPHLTDLNEAIEYLTETMNPVKKQMIEEDLFTDHIRPLMLHKNGEYCPFLQNQLVLDEYNNVSICCVLDKNSEYYSIGSIFERTKEDLIKLKTQGQGICKRCLSAGVPYWYSHNYLPEELQVFNTQTYCYINTGEGFSEKQKVAYNIYYQGGLNTLFRVFFDLRRYPDVKSLRWDPIEGQLCSVKIDEIQINSKNGEHLYVEPSMLEINGIRLSKKEFEFDTIDPWVVIPVEGPLYGVTILGSWRLKSIGETVANLYQQIIQCHKKIQSLEQTVIERNAQIDSLNRQIHPQEQEIVDVSSASTRINLDGSYSFIHRILKRR